MSDKYILNDKGEPVPEPDLHTWGRWMGTRHHIVDVTEINQECRVSTIFLGLDHSFTEGHEYSGPPILWETRVFGGLMNRQQERCSGSREQAEAMHAAMVARVKKELL